MTGSQKLARYSRNKTTRIAAGIAAAVDDAALKTSGEKTPYQAYRLSKSERRYLEIRPKFPQPADIQSNAMLTALNGEWRMGLGLTLKYGTSMMVEIKGENLTELLRALQEWKVEFVEEFDPEMHEPPTDPAAPFIRSIEILTERPAPPPPLSQRH